MPIRHCVFCGQHLFTDEECWFCQLRKLALRDVKYHEQEYIEILQEIQVYTKRKEEIEKQLLYLKSLKENKEKLFEGINYTPKLTTWKVKSFKFGKVLPDGTEEIICQS